ncbi:hypothetical protein ANN_04122 [Periplaneta americana]|uniref:Uncharacterized protein n=1 Tax=Periplaneta americana TaxID=6978 RepID=A0ABQ8T9K4_PERAM|nr:hypothetical protein ANN_04122 [Periplaneta americana]
MAGICEGGNEPPGSLKASNRVRILEYSKLSTAISAAIFREVMSEQKVEGYIDVRLSGRRAQFRKLGSGSGLAARQTSHRNPGKGGAYEK